MSATCLCSNTSLLANFSESGSAWFLALLQSGASYQSRSSGTGIASRIVSNISQLFPGEELLPVGNSTPQMLANLSCVDAPTDTSTTAGKPAAGMKVEETMRACIGGGGMSDYASLPALRGGAIATQLTDGGRGAKHIDD